MNLMNLMNQNSSLSHASFSITLEQRLPEGKYITAMFHLVGGLPCTHIFAY